ncbi:MAG: sel1 repeat family protein [Clostridia bacterium]|nr:sel1 repeat family protein [Clostridia bacterium]
MEQKKIDELLEKMEEEIDEVRENSLYEKETILEEYAEMGIAEAIYQLAELERYELDNNEYAEELYNQAAEKGYPKAYWKLGIIYSTPKFAGGYEDDEKAKELYEKAAELGCAEASYELGEIYNSGIGVEQDKQKAFSYFEKSAEEGYPEALATLSAFYANGIVVEKDIEKAFELAYKAYIELNNRG